MDNKRKCEKCGSELVDATGDAATDFPLISIEVWCPDCNATYWEVYSLFGYEFDPKPLGHAYRRRLTK